MSEQTTIEVVRREEIGSSASRRLRAAGAVPAVVYGRDRDPVPIQVDRKVVVDLLRESGSDNAVFLLKLKGTGESRHVMTREIAIDPISREIVHIDFQRVDMKKTVRVEVPIELRGTPEGVKNQGGVLDFISREVEVECLPAEIPARLEVDVDALEIGDHIEAGEVPLPEGVTLVDELDKVILSISHSRVAQEVEEAEAAEAEAAETLIEAEKAEPEVIGRVKEGEEEPPAESG